MDMKNGERAVAAGRANQIVVVDDHPDAADIACMLLQALGQRCRAATTGARALEVIAEAPADIVVIDIGLPDISGYDVARALRKRADMRDAYLVALTGWGAADDRVRSIAAGFDQHLLKPADAAMFRRILDAAAERQRQRHVSAASGGPIA
jgi:CheY-like chemotaxis protein